MRIIERWSAFPILFTLYPIVNLYAANAAQVSVMSVLPVLGMSLLATMGVLVLSRRILGDNVKAALFASMLMTLFFSYGHCYSISRSIVVQLGGIDWASAIVRHRYLVPSWGGVFVLGTWLIVRTGNRRREAVPYLNIISAGLVAFPLVNLAVYEIENLAHQSVGKYERGIAVAFDAVAMPNTKPARRRDIYYLILDGYGRQDILRRHYAYENQAFIEFLMRKGFYVASASRANYPATVYSLASSLNMGYLDDLERVGFYEWASLIENNRLEQFLKREGYTIVRFSGPWAGTRSSRFADVTFRTSGEWWGEFTELALRTTMLDRLIRIHELVSVQKHTLLVFEQLAELPAMKGPKFIFAHVLVPQEPFVFDRNGNPAPWGETASRHGEAGIKERYVEQLMFVNKKVARLVDELIDRADVAPIIVIQGDHGPPTDRSDLKNWKYFGPLNAYYLPAGGAARLYPSISPVNSFRLILDYYFGTQMGLLEDKSYFVRRGGTRADFRLAPDDAE